jgi:hypothetical protein
MGFERVVDGGLKMMVAKVVPDNKDHFGSPKVSPRRCH